jgi:hypothetical protein
MMHGRSGRDNVFRSMTDVQLVAAMGPPGGGRTFVTNRFLRHFNILALAQVLLVCVTVPSAMSVCVPCWAHNTQEHAPSAPNKA